MKEPDKIYLNFGSCKKLAEEFNISRASITRYLLGQYRPYNKKIELIHAVRKRALELNRGKSIFVARDANGAIHWFNWEPRKRIDLGRWVNPVCIHEENLYPEEAMPDTAKPQWSDRFPLMLRITTERTHNTIERC